MHNINICKMIENRRHITIDIVGDSVTCGLDHCNNDETYTAQLAHMLAERLPDVSVYRYDGIVKDELSEMEYFEDPVKVSTGIGDKQIDVIRNGIGGNTVRRAINRIHDFTGELANGRKADISVFMFGINDALKSDRTKYVSPEKFLDDYRELLERFRQTEKSEIIIMSATTNDQCIDEHVKMTEVLAKEYNLPYVNHHKIWQMHYGKEKPNFGQGDWLSEAPGDACHPTPEGAKEIAKALLEKLFCL